MYDLIYADYKVRKILEAKFPHAKFEDASDEIHRERFSIEMEGDITDEYVEFIIKEGIILDSLCLNLMIKGDEKGKKRIEKILEKIK